ncbi:MAG: SBBP repeat-containing protein [Verrucomicrobiales bacterium]|nr:SBBP repeat-containing protein [Verrucomicrobiales bacterium]
MNIRNRIIIAVAPLALALIAIQSVAQSNSQPYTFTTLAGGGGFNSPDVPGTAARFFAPNGVAVDSAGNIYVADTFNHAIRKVTPSGVVTTLAGMPGTFGSTDGIGREARFSYPDRVAVDGAGNVYVTETGTIRKVTPEGVVTTLAGLAGISGSVNGTNNAARFGQPVGMALDSAGNIYVADDGNSTIRKVTPVGTNWVVTTIAGLAGNPGSVDGTNSAARFWAPIGLAIDSAGNLYVGDIANDAVRKVTPLGTNWVVTTIAGQAGMRGAVDGTNSAARFNNPKSVAVDSAGNIYVADQENHLIRQVTPVGTNWVVTTLAGLAGNPGSVDGTGGAARFNFPVHVAADSVGNVYVADQLNDAIRKLTRVGTNWVVTTVAGLGGIYGSEEGIGRDALFSGPASVAVDTAGSVYVAEQRNHTIRKVTFAGVVTTLAGLAGYAGSQNGTGTVARFNRPRAIAVDGAGNVYVGGSGNAIIRKVTPAGVVTTLAGSAARLLGTYGLALDTTTNVYVADTFNHTILKVTPSGSVTTQAGLAENPGSADGTGSVARFNTPFGVAVDSATNIYVADTWNHTIRKVTPARVVTTLGGKAGSAGSGDGTGNTARFNFPSGMAVDGAGNVYVADSYNNTIRKLTPIGTNWVVTTLGGMPGFYGTADGTGSTARFSNPNGVAVDSAGNLYVADFYFNTIRKGFPAPMILNSGFIAGQLRFDLTGPPGGSVIVEASSELVNWLPIWTNTFAGLLNFIDPQSGNSSIRFYRAHLP